MDLMNVSNDIATSWMIFSVHFDEEVLVEYRFYNLYQASLLGLLLGLCLGTFWLSPVAMELWNVRMMIFK